MIRKGICKRIPLFLLPLLPSAALADISGTWGIRGPVTPLCTFIQTGSALSGACRGTGAEGPLTGIIDGKSLRWTFTRTNMASGRGIAPLIFTATMDGQSLSGTVTINGNNPTPFTGELLPNALPVRLASAGPATPQAAAAAAGVDTAPPPTVFAIAADGSAVHQQSHMACPAEVAGFRRVNTVMYGQPGFDVSCSYRAGTAPGSAVVTLYMSRAPREPVDAVFELAKSSLVRVSPGVVARTVTSAAPAGFDWLKAGYNEPNGVVTEVFITRISGWDYKLRTTYQPEDAEAVGKVTAALSAGVARTAAPHLAACAASPAPQRNGTRNRDAALLPTLVAATGVAVTTAIQKPRTDAVWCAEGNFNVAGKAYLYWRNATQGADGPVDRITGITTNTAIQVLRTPPDIVDAAAKVIPPQAALNNRTVYGVVMDMEDKLGVIGVFDGRPSPQDVGNLALVQAQKGVDLYATVDKKDGKPTIFKAAISPAN